MDNMLYILRITKELIIRLGDYMAQGNLGNFFLGAPARIEQIPRFDQPQQAAKSLRHRA